MIEVFTPRCIRTGVSSHHTDNVYGTFTSDIWTNIEIADAYNLDAPECVPAGSAKKSNGVFSYGTVVVAIAER